MTSIANDRQELPKHIVADFQSAVGSFCKGMSGLPFSDIQKLSQSCTAGDEGATIAMPIGAVWKMLEVHEALESFQAEVARDSVAA